MDEKNASDLVRRLYGVLDEKILDLDEAVSRKVGTGYVAYSYCAAKFGYLSFESNAIIVDLFTRSQCLGSLTQQRPLFGRMRVTREDDVLVATAVAAESCIRMREALRAGEPVGYMYPGDATDDQKGGAAGEGTSAGP